MAEYTPNLNLYKPSRLDTTIEVDTSLTENFEKIDDAYSDIAGILDDITSIRSNYAKLTGDTFVGQVTVPSLKIVDSIYSKRSGTGIIRDEPGGDVQVNAAGKFLLLGTKNTTGIVMGQDVYGPIDIVDSRRPFSVTAKHPDGNTANKLYFSSAQAEGLSSSHYEPAFMVETTAFRTVHFAASGGGQFQLNVHGNIRVNNMDVLHDGRVNYGTGTPTGGGSGDIYIQY